MNDDKKLEKDVVLLSTRDGTENKKLFVKT